MQIGINLYSKWPYEEIIEAFLENGIQKTFVCIEHPQFEEVMDALAKAEIEVENLHAPYKGHNAIWQDGEEGDKVCNRFFQSIDYCVKYGIKVLVAHVSNSRPMPEITEIGLKRFDAFMAYAKEKGVTIAFESHRYVENVKFILERYPEAGFCLDTCHEDAFTPGVRYMPMWGHRLVATHISDNDCVCDKDMHMLPFDGNIDFEKTAQEFAQCGKAVTLMLELKPDNHEKYANMSVKEYYAKAADSVRKLEKLVRKNIIISVAEKINKIRKADSLVFPIFTDLHAMAKDEKVELLCETLGTITKAVQCDAVINLGDNLGMLGRIQHISNENINALLTDIFSDLYDAVKCPILFANGNHDGIGTDFFEADFWNEMVKNKYGNTNAVYDDEGSYYYVDYEKANTRLVVLSVPSGSDFEAESPTPVWAFGEKQLEWLKNKALNVCGNVIIVMHVPFFYHHYGDEERIFEVWDGKRVRTTYMPALCGTISDREEALEVINAFSNQEGNRLVACFSGHTHIDELWQPHEQRDRHKNGLPCPQIVTAGTYIPANLHEKYGISVDIAVWTPSENSLEFFRIGDGEDRKVLLQK